MKRFTLLVALTTLCVPMVADEPPARPTITGIAEVFVGGDDLKQLFDFYSGTLHLSAAPTLGYCLTSEHCMIVNDHQRIALSPAGTPTQNSLLQMVAFETANIDQLRLYLTSRGIAVSQI